MKTIVCYGDSNTWGANPSGVGRIPIEQRWTGVLARELGANFRVVEEGLNGRTTNLDDIIEVQRNGLTHLRPTLESQAPIDLLTIMLGTNDLKDRFHRNAGDIAQSAAILCDTARHLPVGPEGGSPLVLMMAPPVAGAMGDLESIFTGAIEKSKRFSSEYTAWAKRYALPFLDTSQIIVSSPRDGIHIDPPDHAKLGIAVAAKIRELIGN